MMTTRMIFFIGLIFLSALEVAKVFFIMPFPGSQRSETIVVAYFISNYIWPLRLLGIAAVAFPAIQIWKEKNKLVKISAGALLIIWLAIVYLFNFRFLAKYHTVK